MPTEESELPRSVLKEVLAPAGDYKLSIVWHPMICRSGRVDFKPIMVEEEPIAKFQAAIPEMQKLMKPPLYALLTPLSFIPEGT